MEFMERAGIKEDFTLGYADSAGFRVGTCRPYHFINPRTKRITNIIEHPMQVMEGSLNEAQYMNLAFDEANNLCEKLLNVTYDFNGEVNILFHNSSFAPEFYNKKLYENIINYIIQAK